MADAHIPAPATGIYQADSLILYGVKLNSRDDYGRFDVGEGANSELRLQLYTGAFGQPKVGQTKDEYSIVLAYGYAFDGHCYRFDSNRIFFITGPGGEPAVGCGFDPPADAKPSDPSYRMWRIRASTELLEIASNFGDAKALILDANLPGKRSPTSYAITQAMAHRDGRLSRD